MSFEGLHDRNPRGRCLLTSSTLNHGHLDGTSSVFADLDDTRKSQQRATHSPVRKDTRVGWSGVVDPTGGQGVGLSIPLVGRVLIPPRTLHPESHSLDSVRDV